MKYCRWKEAVLSKFCTMHNNWWSLSCEFRLIAYLYNVITAFLVIVPLPPLGGQGNIPHKDMRGRGGSRCRAQFTSFKYYHIHPVQKTAILELNRRIFMKLCMCTYLANVRIMFCWPNMILLLGGKLWANDRVFHPFSVLFRCDICSMWIQLADTLHARHKWCQVFACRKWLGSWY